MKPIPSRDREGAVLNPQTGPRTPEGKAISSQNAFKHGLCSSMLIAPDEYAGDYNTLFESLYGEYKPATTTEKILFNEMVGAYWRLLRVRKREAGFLAKGADLADGCIQLCHRYATTFDRAFHRNLRTLRQLQKERTSFENDRGKKPKETATPDATQNRARKEAPGKPFVSQNPQAPAEAPETHMKDPQNLRHPPSLARKEAPGKPVTA